MEKKRGKNKGDGMKCRMKEENGNEGRRTGYCERSKGMRKIGMAKKKVEEVEDNDKRIKKGEKY